MSEPEKFGSVTGADRLRILLVNSYFYPAAGGVENYLLNVGRELVAIGHEVTVVTSRSQPDLALSEIIDGMAVHRYVSAVYDAPRGLANRILRIRACRQALCILLNESKFDVVWVRDLESLGAVMPVPRRPPVLYIQAVAFGVFQRAMRGPARSRRMRHLAYRAIERAWTINYGVWLERRLLPACDGRVVLSRAKQLEISSAYGLDPAEFLVIPAGIDTSKYSPVAEPDRSSLRDALGLAADAFVFLYVGRFSREKNPVGLLDAFMRMRPTANVALVMVGPATEEFRQRVSDTAAQAPGPIVLPGPVLEPMQWYRAADAYVLPSLTEGFGQVILEAMASGLPVLGYRPSPGSLLLATEEIVSDGETGLLATYDDPTDLARVMTQIAQNPELARRLGSAGLQYCRADYSWRSVTDRLLEETRAVIRLSGGQRG